MSTKIYNGFRLPVLSMHQLLSIVQDWQLTANAIAAREAKMLVANMAVGYIDEYTLKGKVNVYSDYHVVSDCPLGIAINVFEERKRKVDQTKQRDPLFDFDCNVTFFPLEDKILGIYFCEQDKLIKVITDCSLVQQYGYWDNTDPDEDCSDSEWEQREKDWNNALKSYCSIPAMNGFSIDIVDRLYLWKDAILQPEEYLRYIKSLSLRNRAIDFARRELINNWVNEKLTKEQLEKRELWLGVNEVLKCQKWLEDEGKNIFEDKITEISNKLKKDITKDDLLMKIEASSKESRVI